jgi:integrase/recombinase XerD
MGEWGIYPQLETRRRGELVTMKSGSDLLFRFKEHLRVLGRSKATVEAYSEHVKEYLETISNVQATTRRTLEGYIAGLYEHRTKVGNPYQPGTIALKVRSLKRFFEFLEKANIILINPAELIQEPKPASRLPGSVLTSKGLAIILDQPNLGTPAGIRDRAILEVFYSTGIRLEELCRLTIYDADL